MNAIKLGGLSIDPAAIGSQGNAVLGIRDSGKTYTATWLAERLFEAGVPFTTFDPTGVWRFLRVPAKGRGYPIVVAGGKAGDLPLNPASAPKIVEAAMQSGVSLVIDLFDMNLSKADWRRIVKDSLTLLMHKNQEHGLRHIFLEEAAEFVPQKVLDGDVYSVVERLARMGGNFRLGYTLINQRSQEVNKAVLELCENLFLHRQRGKNALENLKKWLEVGSDSDAEKITSSIASLPTGQCWAWLGGEEHPVLVKVPAKNSFHPDRRAMHGEVGAGKVGAAVDVGKFVATLKDALPAIQAELEANDPSALKRKVADLQKQLKAGTPVAAPAVDLTRERSVAYNAGYEARKKEESKERAARNKALSAVSGHLERAMAALPPFEIATTTTGIPTVLAQPHAPAPVAPPRRASAAPAAPPPEGLSGRHMKVLNGVAWWLAAGIEQPSRAQVAGASGYAPNNGNFNNLVGALKTAGLIEYPTAGSIRLTEAGAAQAEPQDAPTTEELHARVRSIISPRHIKIFDAVLAAHPDSLTRAEVAEASGYQANNGNFNNLVGKIKTLGFIEYPAPGTVRAADWLFI